MKIIKLLLFTISILFFFRLEAQVVANFQNISLAADSFLNGADGAAFYTSGLADFPIDYTDFGSFVSWSGWSISSMRDDTTSGFENQYSAITAAGANQSTNYAVSFGQNNEVLLHDSLVGDSVYGLVITNATYTYLDIVNGSAFSKKFGGEDGTEKDYFFIRFYGIAANNEITDSLDFYLADYRSGDSSKAYVLNYWEWIDLKSFGVVTKIKTVLFSSDTGMFGINTPLYFCLDSLVIKPHKKEPSAVKNFINASSQFKVYPNPTADMVHVFIPNSNSEISEICVYNSSGQLCARVRNNSLSLASLPGGVYFLRCTLSDGQILKKQVLKL